MVEILAFKLSPDTKVSNKESRRVGMHLVTGERVSLGVIWLRTCLKGRTVECWTICLPGVEVLKHHSDSDVEILLGDLLDLVDSVQWPELMLYTIWRQTRISVWVSSHNTDKQGT